MPDGAKYGQANGRAGAAAPLRPSAAPDQNDIAVAGLDLGTNNCRLLIARPAGRSFQVIDSFSRAVRLGDGIERTGTLDNASMDRAVEALKICADKARRADVTAIRCVATAACRQALNGAEFAARVIEETGLPLEVITSEEESRLAVSGCGPLVDPKSEQVLVFDIGGGSTELVLLDLTDEAPEDRVQLVQGLAGKGKRKARVLDWMSAPVGVATLQDKFAEIVDPARRYGLMTWYFEELIADFAPAPAVAGRDKRLQLIGASGSATTIGSSYLGLKRYDRSKVDGLWVPVRAARRIARELASLPDGTRAHHPSIGTDRARLIVASCAILTAILNAWPAQEVRVADRGLREGLIYTQLAELRAKS